VCNGFDVKVGMHRGSALSPLLFVIPLIGCQICKKNLLSESPGFSFRKQSLESLVHHQFFSCSHQTTDKADGKTEVEWQNQLDYHGMINDSMVPQVCRLIACMPYVSTAGCL